MIPKTFYLSNNVYNSARKYRKNHENNLKKAMNQSDLSSGSENTYNTNIICNIDNANGTAKNRVAISVENKERIGIDPPPKISTQPKSSLCIGQSSLG